MPSHCGLSKGASFWGFVRSNPLCKLVWFRLKGRIPNSIPLFTNTELFLLDNMNFKFTGLRALKAIRFDTPVSTSSYKARDARMPDKNSVFERPRRTAVVQTLKREHPGSLATVPRSDGF